MAVARARTVKYLNSPVLNRGSAVESLFKAWIEIEKRLERLKDERESEAASDALLEAQTAIIELCCSTRSHSIIDVLYKLALWRRDAPDIGPERPMQRSDRAAYSAFRDLVALTGVSVALTADDGEDGVKRPVGRLPTNESS